jgi:hypothetical protein
MRGLKPWRLNHFWFFLSLCRKPYWAAASLTASIDRFIFLSQIS